MDAPLFELDSVTVSFGGREVLRRFSLGVPEGAKVVLRGASGSGKSTVLRVMLGFVRPDSGAVRFRGEELTPAVAWRLRKEVAYAGQSADFAGSTAAEAAAAPAGFRAGPGRPGRRELEDAAARFGLEPPVLGQRTGELSGGERHRVALASVALLGRSVYLLDEPTAALDRERKAAVAEHFLGRAGWTVVAAAHDEAWLGREGVRVVELGGGEAAGGRAR